MVWKLNTTELRNLMGPAPPPPHPPASAKSPQTLLIPAEAALESRKLRFAASLMVAESRCYQALLASSDSNSTPPSGWF